MKNTLSITKNCICSCVDSVADGTNSIFVAVDVGNVVNPQFKVWLNDTLKSTVELITNEINYVNLPPDLFTANGVIKFQYLDSEYTGQIFSINFPATLEGNLSVSKTSDYVFTAKYTKSGVVTITVDSALSTTSTNPVQNKVITNKLNTLNSNLTRVNNSCAKLLKGNNTIISQGSFTVNITENNAYLLIAHCYGRAYMSIFSTVYVFANTIIKNDFGSEISLSYSNGKLTVNYSGALLAAFEIIGRIGIQSH